MKYEHGNLLDNMWTYWGIDNKNIKEMKCTSSGCPVQFEGKLITGEGFYFRERHDYATFDIGKTLDDAIDGRFSDKGKSLFHWEEEEAHNTLSAAEIISKLVNRYLKQKAKEKRDTA